MVSESVWLVEDLRSPSGFVLCAGRRGIGHSRHSLSERDLAEMRMVLGVGTEVEEPNG